MLEFIGWAFVAFLVWQLFPYIAGGAIWLVSSGIKLALMGAGVLIIMGGFAAILNDTTGPWLMGLLFLFMGFLAIKFIIPIIAGVIGWKIGGHDW